MNWYKKGQKDFIEGYLMYIPITIMLQSCVGAAATMLLLMKKSNTMLFELVISVMFCMVYNALILGQVKAKLVYHFLWLTLAINMFLIIINLY